MKARTPSLAVLLTLTAVTAASAQAKRSEEGLTIREVAVATGYGAVQLPPLTLSGILPADALNADLITTAESAIDWRNVTRKSVFSVAASGNYTARMKYSQMSAFGGHVTAGAAQTIGKNWSTYVGASGTIANSEQSAFEQTQTQQLVTSNATFDELANAVVSVRSPIPDLATALLFVPINQSVGSSEIYGNRVMATSASASLTYSRTARLSTSVSGGYASLTRVSTSNEPGLALAFPDSKIESIGGDVSFELTRRTHLSGTVTWSKSEGLFDDEVTSAVGSYGWTGRKWFGMAGFGVGVRPPQPVPSTAETSDSLKGRKIGLTYNMHLGYKYGTHTFLAGHTRAFHDGYGYGGRNPITGFGGSVISGLASWYWVPLESKWSLQSNFSLYRSPGNFMFIYTWLSTTDIERQVASHVRIRGEFLFDRHGSKGFEGFTLSREGVRVDVVWMPRKRIL